LAPQDRYRKLVSHIEKRWAQNYGEDTIAELQDTVLDLFVARRGDRLLMAEGLVRAEGTLRSGAQAPALGRSDVGPAARQRMRDVVAQTERFQQDPAVCVRFALLPVVPDNRIGAQVYRSAWTCNHLGEVLGNGKRRCLR
jgi:hypothetical protein